MPPCPSRILVVDDSLDTADSLAMLLKLDGYEVRTANDGIGALNVAREFRPDFMLVDIGLPGADGYTVAERVQREPGLAAVTLVAMSGYGQSQDRARSCAAGFREHLVKPVDPAALQALLARRATTAAARTDEAAQANPQPVRSG